MNPEQYFDEHIAPKLQSLGQACEDNGISLLALSEWAPGECGYTSTIQAKRSFSLSMVDAAARANGNIDVFLAAIIRHAAEHGHQSLYLKQIGIPLTPSPKLSEASDEKSPD